MNNGFYLIVCSLILTVLTCDIFAGETKFDGLDMTMGNLPLLSDAKTRSISPENFTGEKGKGGTAKLGEGTA